MRSSTERIAEVLKAWHAAFGDRGMKSSQLLKWTGGEVGPARKRLGKALQALFPGRALNAQRLGMWLTAHGEAEAGDLKLSGSYDGNKRVWTWSVFKVSSEEEINAELDEAEKAIEAKRAKVARSKSARVKLKALEKAQALLDQKVEREDQERAAERDRQHEEMEARGELRVSDAIKAMDELEGKLRPKKMLYVSPRGGHFVIERIAEKKRDVICDLGFEASIDYLPGGKRYVVRVQGSTLEEVKPIATKLMLTAREVEELPESEDSEWKSKEVWDERTRRWVPADYAHDYTTERLLNWNGEPPPKPRSTWWWNPFASHNGAFTDRTTDRDHEQRLKDYREASLAMLNHEPSKADD